MAVIIFPQPFEDLYQFSGLFRCQMQNIILQNLQEPLLLRRFQHSIQIIRCKIQDIPGIEIRGQTLHIMGLVGFDQDNVSRIQHMTDTIQEDVSYPLHHKKKFVSIVIMILSLIHI